MLIQEWTIDQSTFTRTIFIYIYIEICFRYSPDIHIPLTPASCHFSMLFNFTHIIEPCTHGSIIKASSWHREHWRSSLHLQGEASSEQSEKKRNTFMFFLVNLIENKWDSTILAPLLCCDDEICLFLWVGTPINYRNPWNKCFLCCVLPFVGGWRLLAILVLLLGW